MEWTRSEANSLHQLEVYESPIEVLAQLAEAARVDVTVENVTPVRSVNEWFESVQTIQPGGPVVRQLVRNAQFDIALKNADFLSLMEFWDSHGVYAVFTERSPVAFQASMLKTPARYRALDNFGFVLEFALAGPASDGWSQIVSPKVELIDLAEKLLRES